MQKVIFIFPINYVIRRIDASGIIHAFAGKFPRSGYNGDNQPATDASFYSPQGIACDNRGNVFICDMLNYRIRKVDSLGMITTVAGDGGLVYPGDGGMATSTSIGAVSGITLDGLGEIYFTDLTNSLICKIDNAGVVSTVAGVLHWVGYNGDGVPATSAYLADPWSIKIDVNNDIFIADQGNNRIRKIDLSGMISTYAGTGVDSFNGNVGLATAIDFSPFGIALNSEGGLYVSDHSNNRIRCIASTEGVSGVSEKAARLSLYPDPTTDGRITVDLEDNIPGRAQVHVWDMLGRELMSAEIEANKPEQLAINAPPGIYSLSVAHNGYSHSSRLAIAR
jgi:sugar lactone lactonase YvrE